MLIRVGPVGGGCVVVAKSRAVDLVRAAIKRSGLSRRFDGMHAFSDIAIATVVTPHQVMAMAGASTSSTQSYIGPLLQNGLTALR